MPWSAAAEEEAHHGLFGPGTVTWRVHADPLMGLATLRAMLMRVLHPCGQATVFATQDRVDDPWERIDRTLRYVGVITYGSSAEAVMAGARVRSIHAQVEGRTTDGRGYRGDDPDLLLWLHCCQVASFLDVTHRGGLELGPYEADTYLREQVRTAVAWGLEPQEVPTSRRELTLYFRGIRPQLVMSPRARIFADAVVEPPLPDLMLITQRGRPAWAATAGLAFASLPVWARRLHASRPVTGPASLSQAATTVALHTVRDSLRGRSGLSD